MDIEWRVDRLPTDNGRTTYGQWFTEATRDNHGTVDNFECYTLEDAIRDEKIQNETCIWPGRYQLTLELSQRFGPDTITVNGVKDFSAIRVHGGTDIKSTDGCIIVGDRIDHKAEQISGGTVRGVLARLKAKLKAHIDGGDTVWLTINNP